MSKISEAARAAAVMHFVSDSGDTGLTHDCAVELFDELGSTHGPIQPILDKYDTTRWYVYEHLSEGDWWEQLELLAVSIDLSIDFFEFRNKEI